MSKYQYDAKSSEAVLFLPGRGVQARELNMTQKVLQDQFAAVGRYLFAEGASITGGGVALSAAKTMKVDSNFGGHPINLDAFVGKKIEEVYGDDAVTTGASGTVIAVSEATSKDPACIHYVKSGQVDFGESGNENAFVRTPDALYANMLLSEENAISNCMTAVLRSGKFFYDGYAVPLETQQIVLSKFDTEPSGYLGIYFKEDIVTEFEDDDLYDKSFDTPNYNAPGAHRLRHKGELRFYTSDEQLPAGFSIYMQLVDGGQAAIAKPINDGLDEKLAIRTKDANGSFVVNPFTAKIYDNVERQIIYIGPSGSNEFAVLMAYEHTYEEGDKIEIKGTSSYNGEYEVHSILDEFSFSVVVSENLPDIEEEVGTVNRTDYFGISVSRGRAYVNGYQVIIDSPQMLEISKAKVTDSTLGNAGMLSFGGWIEATNVENVPQFPVSQLQLRDSTSVIGTASLLAIEQTGTSTAKLYLANIDIDQSGTIDNVLAVNAFNSKVFSADVANFDASSLTTSLIMPINDEVKSVDSQGLTTYQMQYSSTAIGSGGVAAFSLAGTDFTFVGPRETNISNMSVFNSYYLRDHSTGIKPTGIANAEIDSSGQLLTITSDSDVIDGLLLVNVNGTGRTKTLQTASLTISASYFDTNSPSYELPVSDVISVYVEDSNGQDVTNKFILDSGTSLGTEYTKAKLTMKSPSSSDALSVTYTYFEPNAGGPFTANSYGSLEPVPDQIVMGQRIDPRNTIDFRLSTGLIGIPTPNTPIYFSYEYYLSRKDLIVINESGEIYVKSGTPANNPLYPSTTVQELTLFMVDVDARTDYPKKDVSVKADQINGYTMKAIGRLDNRIERLETEVSLNALESSAKQTDIVDDMGLSRMKTGIIVDPFTSHGIGEVTSPDYKIAVDKLTFSGLKPLTKTKCIEFTSPTRTTNVGQNVIIKGDASSGYLAIRKYKETTMLSNLLATKAVNVTYFLTTNYMGVMSCEPPLDVWRDTTIAPVHNVPIDNLLPDPELYGIEEGIEIDWGAWETTWTGVIDSKQAAKVTTSVSGRKTTTTTTVTTTDTIQTDEARSGLKTITYFDDQFADLGQFVIDSSVAFYFRPMSVKVNLAGLRPNTDLFFFIDGANRTSWVSNPSTLPSADIAAVRTDVLGNCSFVVNIPEESLYTGDRTFTVLDEPSGNLNNSTTSASYIFTAKGTSITLQDNVITARVPQRTFDDSLYETKTTTSTSSSSSSTSTSVTASSSSKKKKRKTPAPIKTASKNVYKAGPNPPCKVDPIAQSFFIDEDAYPSGVFLSSIDLYFRSKPTTSKEPIVVEIRPVVNGYPSSFAVPGSTVVVDHESIATPTNIFSINSIMNAKTNVQMKFPIYLEPGDEYAVVVMSNSTEYEVYVAEMGQPILSTDEIVVAQPLLGSAFRSQNATTWTAYQQEDMMLALNICEFSTEGEGRLSFISPSFTEGDSNIGDFNACRLQIADFTMPGTAIGFSANLVDKGTMSSQLMAMPNQQTIELASPKIIRPGRSGEVKIDLFLQTEDEFVSPVIDMSASYMILVENMINNFGLTKSGFYITNSGSGYDEDDDIVIVGDGVGARAKPILLNGRIVDIDLIDPGENYTSVSSITVNTLTGSNASITYAATETAPSNGNASARYISKIIELADGFASDQADMYLDVAIPPSADVKVYYRVLSANDGRDIRNLDWIEALPNFVPKRNVMSEIRYKMNMAYSYQGQSFAEASKLQTKIVLVSSNSSQVPIVKNMRIITSL